MSLLGDHQTGSYWDHITGECVHGPLKGRKLELEPLRHMRTDQALAQFPDARIASSRSLLPFGLFARIMDLYGRLLGQGRFVPPMLLSHDGRGKIHGAPAWIWVWGSGPTGPAATIHSRF